MPTSHLLIHSTGDVKVLKKYNHIKFVMLAVKQLQAWFTESVSPSFPIGARPSLSKADVVRAHPAVLYPRQRVNEKLAQKPPKIIVKVS